MKKLFVVLGLLLIATMLFVGCGKTDNSSVTQAAPLSQDNTRTGTLQGKIMDALTGFPVGSDATGALSIYLIQGSADRGPDKLHTDPNDPLCGEYSFSGIPADLYEGNASFKVVVIRPGYQRFEADVELQINHNDNDIVLDTLDSVINVIGNIYLYPEGVYAGDVKIIVRDPSGVLIPDATIMVYQDVEDNLGLAHPDNDLQDLYNYTSNIGFNPSSDTLYATGGLYTSMTVTTDANGVATLSGTKLVLGGEYEFVVLEKLFNGQILGEKTGIVFVSTVNPDVVVNMSIHTDSAILFATSASNQEPGTITSTGALSITFNQPILLGTTMCEADISNGVITVGTATYINDAPILGTLTNGNTTLTFEPVISTAPTATALGATITYHNCNGLANVILKNTQTSSGLHLFDAGGVSTIVNASTGAVITNSVLLQSN